MSFFTPSYLFLRENVLLCLQFSRPNRHLPLIWSVFLPKMHFSCAHFPRKSAITSPPVPYPAE